MVLNHHLVDTWDDQPSGFTWRGDPLVSSEYSASVLPFVAVVIKIVFHILAERFERGHIVKVPVGHVHRACVGGVTFFHTVFAELADQFIEYILAAFGDAVERFEIGVTSGGFPQMSVFFILELCDCFVVGTV